MPGLARPRPRRDRHGDLHLGIDGRSQGRGPLASQHPAQCPSDRGAGPSAPDEVLLGILPFFHSFGFTVTIWTALALGKKVVYHFNPLDARTIGKLCEEHKVTLIAGTPSFTRFYIKNCPAEQFKTLTHLILGAEKLKPELDRDINQMAGHRADGGLRHHRAFAGRRGQRPGRDRPAGRPEDPRQPAGDGGAAGPGTAIKTVDPDTGADLPDGAEGVIAVKGPQVMVGYLNKPEATAKVLKDGWYATGDLGYVDADGFLKITDRLSRFSKIAGEMVPHLGVESAIMEVAGVDEHHVAVTALPDPKHGERLCVLYTDLGMSPDEIHKAPDGRPASPGSGSLRCATSSGSTRSRSPGPARSTSAGSASWPRASGWAEASSPADGRSAAPAALPSPGLAALSGIIGDTALGPASSSVTKVFGSG